MNNSSPSSSNQVTLMVFKDGFVSRTFQVSLGWITRVGVLIGLAGLVTILALATAGRSYYLFKVNQKQNYASSPERLKDLEREVLELKASNEALQAKTGVSAPVVTLAPSTSQPPAAPIPEAVTPLSGLLPRGALFSGLPLNNSGAIPDPATLPFKLHQPKAVWRGSSLNVNFAIQYTRDDGGNQQGHIILLARGPETILSYPDGVLHLSGAETLIKPEAGEYFSVSRYREVNANFDQLKTREQIQEIQVIIVDNAKRVIFTERIIPEKGPAVKKPKAKASETETSGLTESAAPTTGTSADTSPPAPPATDTTKTQ